MDKLSSTSMNDRPYSHYTIFLCVVVFVVTVQIIIKLKTIFPLRSLIFFL